MDRIVAAGAALALVWGTVGGAHAQERVSLTEPEAALAEGFGLVQSVRELPDGRVLFADPMGKVLVAADLGAGAVDTIGQEGAGPDEYRQPDAVFALAGDSTLLLDLGNARLTVIGPDLAFGATHPLATGSPGPGGNFSVRLPQGVDAEGRVYYRAMMRMGGGEPPTHGAVMRWDRGTEAVDSLTAVLRERLTVQRSGGPNNQSVSMSPIPLSPQDGWAVAWDGRLAVVRAEPYRVEWIWPDGRMVQGPVQEYAPVPIGQAEKEEWAEARDLRGGGVGISVGVSNGSVQTSFQRGGQGSGRQDLAQYDWPDAKPAFESSGVLVSPLGEVWVRRHRPAGEPAAYDVFGTDGALRYTVETTPDRRVVGFGARGVYVTRTDEFGLQYLERHAAPGV